MPEEKDKSHNQGGEPSLEDQLLALLKGLPAKPPEETPSEAPPPEESPKGGENTVSPLSEEISSLLDMTPPAPESGTPGKSDTSPLTEELATLLGVKLPETDTPKVGPPLPDISALNPDKTEAPPKPGKESKDSLLKEEITGLFGSPPTETSLPQARPAPTNTPGLSPERKEALPTKPPEESKSSPLAEGIAGLFGSPPTETALPKARPAPTNTPGSGPELKEALPTKPPEESKSSPLAEGIAGLFGTPSPAPSPATPLNKVTGPTLGKSPVFEPAAHPAVPAIGRLATAPGILSPSEVAGTEIENVSIFKTEAIIGPKIRRPLFGLNLIQKHTISLSIEGTSLRILTLMGNSVETWASVSIDPQLLREGHVANIGGMGEAIAKAMSSQSISPGRLVCSVTALGSISRTLSLPQAARKDLANIIPRELKRANINTDNYSISWQVMPGKLGPIQVYIIGVPKEPLAALLEALRHAKLKPAAIDLKPIALARAVNRRDAIIAHSERDALEMAIVVEAVPTLLRSIYLGNETTPDSVVARLTEELERTISFYDGTHRQNPLNPQIPIYVTGEIANYPDLIKDLGSTLGRNMGALEPPIELPKDFPIATFMVNIGLVLKKF